MDGRGLEQARQMSRDRADTGDFDHSRLPYESYRVIHVPNFYLARANAGCILAPVSYQKEKTGNFVRLALARNRKPRFRVSTMKK